jgi:hypothetical protein
MADDFRKVISDLFTKLNLGKPSFGDREAIVLTIDRREITLRESDDGRHLVVSGKAGRLSSDPRLRGEQIRRLLKVNLGMLQTSQSGVALVSTEEEAFVEVQAVYPYAMGRIDQLMSQIETVLDRLERHASELSGSAAPSRPKVVETVPDDAFIFRA